MQFAVSLKWHRKTAAGRFPHLRDDISARQQLVLRLVALSIRKHNAGLFSSLFLDMFACPEPVLAK
jgi:hypothetical protein